MISRNRLKWLLPAIALCIALAGPGVARAADVTFGTTTIGTAVPPASGGANFLVMSGPYDALVTGTVSKLTGYVSADAETPVRGVIYADDAGAPGAFVGVTPEVTLTNATAAWVDFPFDPSQLPSVTAGNKYWLGYWIGGNQGHYSYNAVTGSEVDAVQPYSSTGLPAATFPSDNGVHDSQYSLYATVTPSGGGDTTAPTIVGSASPAANANGWNSTNVVVSFKCTDNDGGSGVASVSGPTTLTNEGADQTVTGTCTDNASNSASTTVHVSIDKTAPTVSYSGNAGTYTVDQTVAITCTASDNLSGVDPSSTCADVTGPAYSFGLGQHQASANVLDKAGNTASASTSFTVTVTGESLCTLTGQFVASSARYAALSARQKAVVDRLTVVACDAVGRITPRLQPFQAKLLVALYKAGVVALEREGWLSQSQGSTLINLANSL